MSGCTVGHVKMYHVRVYCQSCNYDVSCQGVQGVLFSPTATVLYSQYKLQIQQLKQQTYVLSPKDNDLQFCCNFFYERWVSYSSSVCGSPWHWHIDSFVTLWWAFKEKKKVLKTVTLTGARNGTNLHQINWYFVLLLWKVKAQHMKRTLHCLN